MTNEMSSRIVTHHIINPRILGAWKWLHNQAPVTQQVERDFQADRRLEF